jgi:hypothetical protein
MVVTSLKKPPPPRDYPNMNALHGIRFHFDSTDIQTVGGIQTPQSGLKFNAPVLVGTIPAKAFIHGMTWHVLKATTAACTLDVGTKAAPTKWLAAGPLNAVARNDAAATTYGYIGDSDTPVYATLKGNADPAGGIFSFLIYYYPKIGD